MSFSATNLLEIRAAESQYLELLIHGLKLCKLLINKGSQQHSLLLKIHNFRLLQFHTVQLRCLLH